MAYGDSQVMKNIRGTEIEVHLEVIMELLQKNKEDQRCGFLVRRNMRWHKLHKRREKLMNVQWECEVLEEREYLGEDLKTKVSSEAKRPQYFKIDILCMLAGEKNEERQFSNIDTNQEGDRKNLNSVQKEDGTVGSHSNTHAQLRESASFQHTTKDESK